MNILGKNLDALYVIEPTQPWEIKFNELLERDHQLACNYLVRADTQNGGRHVLDELFGESVGALVFNAFYQASHEAPIGMPPLSCAYARCSVRGGRMVYMKRIDGKFQLFTEPVPA